MSNIKKYISSTLLCGGNFDKCQLKSTHLFVSIDTLDFNYHQYFEDHVEGSTIDCQLIEVDSQNNCNIFVTIIANIKYYFTEEFDYPGEIEIIATGQ